MSESHRPEVDAREERLLAIRREAASKGWIDAPGTQPAGAPFPRATADAGYYGLPLLKAAPWRWQIPAYFFVGGAAGAASVIATAAEVGNWDGKLSRDARWVAAVGGILSPMLLTRDLGRPSRFLYMMRVFKLQSPMSVGTWALGLFSSAAVASLADEVLDGRFKRGFVRSAILGPAQFCSAVSGAVLTSYTGVLIGATAIPVWSENATLLPLHFAASGLGAAASVLELMGHDGNRALNSLAIGAAIAETAAGAHIEVRKSPPLRPLKKGKSGWLTRIGGLLSGPLPLVLRILARRSGYSRSRQLRRAAAVSAITGSVLTRFGWVQAGRASANDLSVPLQLPQTDQQRRLEASDSREKTLTV